MRSLRLRLFAGILGAALAAVVVSLAIGVILTRGAVRDQIADEVASQANLIALQLSTVRDAAGDGPAFFQEPGAPPPGVVPSGGAVVRGDRPATRAGRAALRDRLLMLGPAARSFLAPAPDGGPPGAGPPGLGAGDRPRPQILTLRQARELLPASAFAELRAGGEADGRGDLDGERQIFSARRVGPAVALAARPAAISADDFSDYLGGLLLAGALAALLAGLAAALLARRLTAPIARVGDAARSLAAGRDPGRLPPERTTELAALSRSFNEMSEQLARSREAERAVLLSVSHELRTPLTAISGYAEGLADGTVEPAVAAEVVGREADRLGRLVGDLLALVKLEQGVLEIRSERVDLAEVAHEAERRLRPQATAGGVAVSVEVDDGEPAGGPAAPTADRPVTPTGDAVGMATATADADRAVQVVSNLVENAIRVTPSGGRVVVRAGPGVVTVSDTGPGIPAEDLDHAFDRFHLRRRHGRGSPDGAGLGLAIVRDLTEAMGGEVSVASADGEGATFTVRLPPATRPAAT
jgi:signal transduction histidine kinase